MKKINSISSESSTDVEATSLKKKMIESINLASQSLAIHLSRIDLTKKFNAMKLGEVEVNRNYFLLQALIGSETVEPDIEEVKEFFLMHTFDLAVKEGILKMNNLTPSELIGTFDAILACMVSWLLGDSMDHGLYTCLYLHTTSDKQIKDKAMNSFCHAIRCIIGQVQNIVEMGNVNEENNFEVYGSLQMPSYHGPVSSTVTGLLKDAEKEWLYLSKLSTSTPKEDYIGVLNRLQFIINLYEIIYKFEMFMMSSPKNSFVSEVFEHININLDLMPNIIRTVSKGTKPKLSSGILNTIGFSSRNPKRCLPTPKCIMQKLSDRYGAWDYLEELMQRLQFVCRIMELEEFYSTLEFFVGYSNRTQDCILSRSILQGIFCNDRNEIFGLIPLKEYFKYSAYIFNSPRILNPKHVMSSDTVLQRHVEIFFNYCVNTGFLCELVCVCGYNYKRQRSMLSDLLESYHAIQDKAIDLDAELLKMAEVKESNHQYGLAADLRQSAQFSIWILYITLRAMNMYLVTGFEMELYTIDEFIYIYWYSYDLLFGSMSAVLQRAANNLLKEDEYINRRNKLRAMQRSRNYIFEKYTNPTIKLFYQDIMYYHGYCNMAGGMFKALIAFTKAGRIHKPKTFNYDECLFNQRFRAFQNLICPVPVTYKEYKKTLNQMMRLPTLEIYAEAACFFDEAHTEFNYIENPSKDILDVIIVAKTNFVAMSVLSKGYQKDSKEQPEFRFSPSAYFPIIKIN